MSSIQVQPFHRRDRQQLADLVNAHAAAVVPGAGVSVAALLSHLEREPGEFLVDPWVRERVTLVARQNDRVAAAAHLLRYDGDERVGPAYRNSGEIRWLLFWPEARSARTRGGRASLPFAELTRTRRGWTKPTAGSGTRTYGQI